MKPEQVTSKLEPEHEWYPTVEGKIKLSIAVSLKRIADAMDLFATSLIEDHIKKEADMRDWANRHGFGDLWDKAHG